MPPAPPASKLQPSAPPPLEAVLEAVLEDSAPQPMRESERTASERVIFIMTKPPEKLT
jgi:hypothetical protein